MRACTRIAALFFVMACTATPLCAQIIPWNIAVDSSFRIEYLLGRQTLGREYIDSSHGPIQDLDNYSWFMQHPDPIDRLRIEFGPSLPILEATVEITPFPSFSGRLAASLSVLESTQGVTLVSGPASTTFVWNNPYVIPAINLPLYGSGELSNVIKPAFRLWEAAGLYHLSSEGGYRWSIVGGYRYETWTYSLGADQGSNSYLRDEFVSQSPFLGLQTAMFFPWWKARFEVLGSPFMTKKISLTARDSGYYMQLDGTWNKGGFIEFQTEGTVNVTPSIWLGLFARYTYEELRGEAKGTRAHPGKADYETFPYNFYTLKSMATIGFNFNVVF
ncbi:MAG: hypothetical protein NTW27_01930 [Deltaproteobacteria bacterium]|nr:hypothetical protein [Deltaproteobacteria bacterium]